MNEQNIIDFVEYNDGYLIWKNRPRDHFKKVYAFNDWNKNHVGKIAGSIRHNKKSCTRYVSVQFMKKKFHAHRVVWEIFNGQIPNGFIIDHIDGNGTNNRIENLRLATCQGNNKNSSRHRNRSVGPTGVFFNKKANKWIAQIKHNYEPIYLGCYDNMFDAVCVRKSAETKYGFHENHGRYT